MIYSDGISSFFLIRERRFNQYVAKESSGNIISYRATGGEEQKWLIYAVEGGKVRIQNLANGDFMAVGSDGNVLAWRRTEPGAEQEFLFNHHQKDGWFNIQESTGNYVAVGSNGNVLRWDETGRKDQQFKLEAVDRVPRPKARAGDHEAGKVPDPPALASLEDNPSDAPEKHFVGEEVIPSALINDPDYTNKLVQVRTHPYYYLRREQYWDSAEGRGQVKLFTGRETETYTLTTHKGISETHMTRITKVVGWKFNATLSQSAEVGVSDPATGLSAKKSVSASLGLHYQNQKTSVSESKKSTEEWRRETTEVIFPPQEEGPFKVVFWSLVDSYTLLNSERNQVDRWEVILPRRVRRSYPKKLQGVKAV